MFCSGIEWNWEVIWFCSILKFCRIINGENFLAKFGLHIMFAKERYLWKEEKDIGHENICYEIVTHFNILKIRSENIPHLAEITT